MRFGGCIVERALVRMVASSYFSGWKMFKETQGCRNRRTLGWASSETSFVAFDVVRR